MKKSTTLIATICAVLFALNSGFSQSPSFKTFVNPIIPGDHPDPTLTKIGDYFYSSGSSFNPTPKLYRSTNLVHWEVIAQPVTSEWDVYGDDPGGGIWGGHMVLHHGQYWHYFGRGGGAMYFVTADDPEGPWSYPTQVEVPSGLWGLGVDNSIFIDEITGNWYLITKAGHANNHLVELGEDGQPTGNVLDLTWLNPADDDDNHPYGWAEGPVMWKHNEYYYYSFAEHLVGEQYVMRSDTLTDDPDDWEVMDGNMFYGWPGTYNRPNHISPAVTLDDETSWAIGHSYHSSSEWYAQGRQGLLHQLVYNDEGWPMMQYPSDQAETAPSLPSGGVPWMVPKSDMFNESSLDPEWSLLGYTPEETYSVNEKPGWLYLEPYRGSNTVIKNDGEHQYSLITLVDFDPDSETDEAGLWIFNGPETHFAKIYSTLNNKGENVIAFSYEDEYREVQNTSGSIVWLKLIRDRHMISGLFSEDGHKWYQLGEPVNAVAMGREQSQFNDFTGNQQGLFVEGKHAFFNIYIYRDAYTDIDAARPANRYGVTEENNYLGNINNDDWALYAGVEFGSPDDNADYQKEPEGISLVASSESTGGIVEVWLDSIDTGQKISQIEIENTGGWSDYTTFTADIEDVSGRHDVYLRFKGDENAELFRIQNFKFKNEKEEIVVLDIETENETSLTDNDNQYSFSLEQNYPNPFNANSDILFTVPQKSHVTLNLYDLNGNLVETLIDGKIHPGTYNVTINADNYTSGVYIYRLETDSYNDMKRMIILK